MASGQFALFRRPVVSKEVCAGLAFGGERYAGTERTQVEREFLLRNAAMGSQPRTQQGPKAFHRINMNLVEAFFVFIVAVADGVVIKTPSRQ